MEVLERVADLFRTKQQKKIEDFQELVAMVAGAKPPTPEKIAAALEAIGRSPDELAEGVLHRQRRAALRAEWQSLPDLLKLQKSLQQDYEIESQRHAAEIKRHEDALSPLRFRAPELQERIDQAEAAKTKLQNSYVVSVAEGRFVRGDCEVTAKTLWSS